MTWNWHASPNDCVYVDFETQSASPIKKVGGRRYAEDSSTRVACCAFVNGETSECTVWVPQHRPGMAPSGTTVGGDTYDVVHGDLPDWVLHKLESGATFVAHNASGFDCHIWRCCVGWPQPKYWLDTAPLCRAFGLPGHLDGVAQRLLGRGKDPMGYRLIHTLCISPIKNGEVVYPVGTPAAWDLLVRYCADDALKLPEIHNLLPIIDEPDLLDVHFEVCERGVPIDRAYAARLAQVIDKMNERTGDRMEEVTQEDLIREMARSVKKVKAWLLTKGLDVPSLERKELTRFFKEQEAFVESDSCPDDISAAMEFLRLRQESARVGKSKVLSFIDHSHNDGRARDQFMVYGAHTRRWTSKGIQLHNLPRGTRGVEPWRLGDEPTLETVDLEAERVKCTPADVIASCLRGTIAAPEGCVLIPADFAAIEARGIAWVARDEPALDLFRDIHADPYLVLGARIFGRAITKKDERERFIAKQAELGCGYSMSWKKFLVTLENFSVNLAEHGISAETVVKAYRQQHPRIVKVWRELHDTVHGAVSAGLTGVAGRCEFSMRDGHLRCELPSGGILYYRDARIDMEVPGYCALFGLPPVKVPTVTYAHPHGYRGILYGGRIAENIVQALCRDLLALAFVKCERENLCPVFHAHDEIVSESDEAKAEQNLRAQVCIMSEPPAWAPDFPIMVEGWTCRRYGKVPEPGAFKANGFNGSVV